MPLDEFGVVVDAPNFFLRGRCCLLSAMGCGEFGVAVKTLYFLCEVSCPLLGVPLDELHVVVNTW